MDALRNRSPWCGLQRADAIGLRVTLLGVVGTTPLLAQASQAGAASPFELSDAATLKPGASVQHAGTLQLQATLSTPGGGTAASADSKVPATH